MKGSIRLRDNVRHPYWCVAWYDPRTRNNVTITRYIDGSILYQTHQDPARCQGYQRAQKILTAMRADIDRGLISESEIIDRYNQPQYSNVVDLMDQWLSLVKNPGTKKRYASYVNHHFRPFFQSERVMLHEINLSVLYKLKDSLTSAKTKNPLEPKGQWCAMSAFSTFLTFAFRCGKIDRVPPFPRKAEYGMARGKVPVWLTKEDHDKVMAEIPAEDRDVFLFAYYTFRRPSEACALYKTDYNAISDSFTIQRGVSVHQVVPYTKTHQIHTVPCKSQIRDMIHRRLSMDTDSPFMFVNRRATGDGGRYNLDSLNLILRGAFKRAGVRPVTTYNFLKHSACTHYLLGVWSSELDPGTVDELKMITDLTQEAIEHYAAIVLDRKRRLMEAPNVIEFPHTTRTRRNI